MATSDVELLRAWRDGDLDSGDRLFSRYFDRVYRFFHAKLGRDVEELTQRTFEACVTSVDTLRDHESFRAFVFGIARNQLLRFLYEKRRERRRIIPQEHSVRDLGLSASGAVAVLEVQRVLLEAMRGIPIDHQIALELFYWEDMSVAEIASALGVPAGTIKSRLSRAKDKVRDQIEQMKLKPSLRDDTLARLEDHTRDLAGALARKENE